MNKKVIVIGSGLAGVHAAYPLVEAGVEVLMLDVGFLPKEDDVPSANSLSFEAFRAQEPEQYKTFLGEDLTGLASLIDEHGHAGAMTSGRRDHVVESTDKLLPTSSKEVVITQSLAQGGLSEAWGAVGAFLSEKELNRIGLPVLRTEYERIIERIGVSGEHPDYVLQPKAELDTNSLLTRAAYEKNEKKLRAQGLILEQPSLALLTKNIVGRDATAYRDMEFWNDADRARYRARYTLEELKQFPNFSYVPHQLVIKIKEESGIRVSVRDVSTNESGVFVADAVILAAGAVNSTRILLKSFDLFDTPVPFVAKDHYLLACVQLNALGKRQNSRRHSLCQLTLTAQDTGMYAQLYSYRSLLLHKLLPYVPLPAPQALAALSALAPAITLVDVRFPSSMDEKHTCMLRKESVGDRLEITYPDTSNEKLRKKELTRLIRALRTLGLIPISTVRNPYGATSHYAGGVPVSEKKEEYPLTVDVHGLIRGTNAIYVADSATWRGLPAKPPGFTLMANAHRTGAAVLTTLST